MKYVDEYRDRSLVEKLAREIKRISTKNIRIMEVCGGHTMAIQKFGIPSLLPETIKLLSGPGCPVCVTSRTFIDQAVEYSKLKDVIITTYGDLIRVPGSYSSLEQEKASGADVRIIYSSLEALNIAIQNPLKKVIFLGIGFETTTPASAVSVLEAQKHNINNFFLFSAHKLMPPAMSALIDNGVKIDGYIGPGHVTTVAGPDMYNELVKKYGIAIVISGFEPVDLLQSVYMLVKQIETGKKGIEVQYKRVVSAEGNKKASHFVEKAFITRDDWWRGLGVIKNSGLKLNGSFKKFDAEIQIPVNLPPASEPKGCICGEVLKGVKSPFDCKLFRKVCTPENPVGACMVSNEGSCHAYFRYNS